MTIYLGSRYETSPVTSIDVDGIGMPTVLRGPITVPAALRVIVVSEHQNLQQLAMDAYGDAEKWWRIADANPTILYPDRIAPGTVLVVP